MKELDKTIFYSGQECLKDKVPSHIAGASDAEQRLNKSCAEVDSDLM